MMAGRGDVPRTPTRNGRPAGRVVFQPSATRVASPGARRGNPPSPRTRPVLPGPYPGAMPLQPLTDQGWQAIKDLAGRYGISTDAVMAMLQALVRGNGSMAQFNHPELGGGGQWMRGGMT